MKLLDVKPTTQEEIDQIIEDQKDHINSWLLRTVAPIAAKDQTPEDYLSTVYDKVVESIKKKDKKQQNRLQQSLPEKLVVDAIMSSLSSKDLLIHKAVLNTKSQVKSYNPAFFPTLFKNFMNLIECDFKDCTAEVLTQIEGGQAMNIDKYLLTCSPKTRKHNYFKLLHL